MALSCLGLVLIHFLLAGMFDKLGAVLFFIALALDFDGWVLVRLLAEGVAHGLQLWRDSGVR